MGGMYECMSVIITRKCYSIGQVKVSSSQAVLYYSTSLSWLGCVLCVLYLYCRRRNITLGGYLDTRRNI